MKIGQYLAKLWARVRCLVFLTHGVQSCRDLGITMTHDLSFSEHINNMVFKAHQRANAILRCFVSRYDTRCYFNVLNVRWKADISQLNLPHGTDN